MSPPYSPIKTFAAISSEQNNPTPVPLGFSSPDTPKTSGGKYSPASYSENLENLIGTVMENKQS